MIAFSTIKPRTQNPWLYHTGAQAILSNRVITRRERERQTDKQRHRQRQIERAYVHIGALAIMLNHAIYLCPRIHVHFYTSIHYITIDMTSCTYSRHHDLPI